MSNALRIIVRGRVQGVGFRYLTKEKALQLGLKGWVRNTFDGNVEIHCQGSIEQIKALLVWIEEGGAPYSRITSFESSIAKYNNNFKSFFIAF